MKKLIVATVLCALAAACVQPPAAPKAPELKLSIPAVAEETVWQTRDYNGKPILIAFMGSWCPWCKRSLPALDAASKQFDGQVEVVGAFVDEELPAVQAVVKEHNMKTKALYNAGEAAGQMHVSGFPHIMLFDKNHQLVKVWSGYSPTLEEEFTVEINKALK